MSRMVSSSDAERVVSSMRRLVPLRFSSLSAPRERAFAHAMTSRDLRAPKRAHVASYVRDKRHLERRALSSRDASRNVSIGNDTPMIFSALLPIRKCRCSSTRHRKRERDRLAAVNPRDRKAREALRRHRRSSPTRDSPSRARHRPRRPTRRTPRPRGGATQRKRGIRAPHHRHKAEHLRRRSCTCGGGALFVRSA